MAEAAKKPKSIFQHLSGIKEQKVKWDSLSDVDKKSFSPFIINRWLSMNMEFLPIINELQKYTIGLLKPKEVYKVYFDFLPKRKTFDKYVKGNKDQKYNKELLSHLSKWYGVSNREVIDYLDIISKDEVIDILMKFGLSNKEAKKVNEMNEHQQDQIKVRIKNLESDLNFQKEEIEKRLARGADIHHSLEYMATIHMKIETLKTYWPNYPKSDTNQLLKG